MKNIFTWLDDPIMSINDWFFHLEQNQMRRSILSKYKNESLTQTYWVTGTDNDFEGLSNDENEREVQRLTLSQISFLLAHRVFAKRNYFVVPLILIISSILISGFKSAESFATQYIYIGLMCALSFMLIFGTTFFAPVFAWLLLPNVATRQDEINEVEATIKRCVIRELPDGTPDDLKDHKRLLMVDAYGSSVAGQILATDLEFSALRFEWLKTKNILRLFGYGLFAPVVIFVSPLFLILLWIVSFYSFEEQGKALKTGNEEKEHSNLLPIFGYILVPILILISSFFDSLKMPLFLTFLFFVLAVIANYRYISPLEVRAIMLNDAVRENGTELLIDKAGKQYFINQENAKIEQVNNAIADKTPFIPLGVSTALLSSRRDNFSPTEKDLPMGLSIKDLSTHLFALGASGTGKTFNVIRPVTKQWLEFNQGGLVVLDGKGALPLEIQNYCQTNEYVLISPKDNIAFNPILGMSPDSFADTFSEICRSGKESDPFWSDSARILLRHTAHILTAGDTKLSFNGIQQFINLDDVKRDNLIKVLNIQDDDIVIKNSLEYFATTFPAIPEKTRASIVGVLNTWLGNIVNSKPLANWVETLENSINIEDVFTGKKIGILLPETEYGKGGAIISALIMRRIYDAAKKRGDNWVNENQQKPVLMVADEIQNLLTNADIDNVAISRSLGLYLLMASQNIDGLYNKLSRDGAIQMLGNFASLVALPPKTKDSNDYLSLRVGSIWKSSVSMYFGLPDSQSDLNIFNNNGTDGQLQNIGLYRRGRASRPRLAYSLSLSDKDLSNAPKRSLEDLVLCDQPNKTIEKRPNLSLDVTPLANADEIDGLLAKPYTALAIFNRGGVVRRDVVQLGGVK